MTSSKQNNKPSEDEQFKLIRSGLEVRRLLERCITDDCDFLVKGQGDNLFGFRPDQVDTSGLHGRVVPLGPLPKTSENVVVNFSVGTDRYFTLSDFFPFNERGLLAMDQTLYKLERRGHLRVQIPRTMENLCNLIDVDGKVVFLTGMVLDLSRGGARLLMPIDQSKSIQLEQSLRFVLHLGGKWRLELGGKVKHQRQYEGGQLFGVEFQALAEDDARKLISVTMELVREQLRIQRL
jgi:hypothetical protein